MSKKQKAICYSEDSSINSNVIAFIAYGEANTRQAIFSICSILLSLKNGIPSFSLVVYSNKPEEYEFLKKYIQISIRRLLDEDVKQAILPENYFPKLKIMLMDTMLASGDIKNLILVDSDTFFRKDPKVLFKNLDKGCLLMHLYEWDFRKGRKGNPILCPNDGNVSLSSGRVVGWNDNSEMYNVGVIGINAKMRNLISDSLEFIVKYFAMYPSWHVEQLCVSIVFQQQGGIRFAKKQVYHYWHNKSFFDQSTVQFFSLIDAGEFDQALDAAKRLIPSLEFKINLRYFFSEVRKVIRDFPGVYLTYKKLIKPFYKINHK